MGLVDRIMADRRTEQRVIGGVPWRLNRPWDSPYWGFNLGGPVHPSRAFSGVDQALGLPALYSCTRLLAENLASLPIKIYLSPPGSSVTTRYTGPSLFDQPSATGTTFDWIYQCMTALLLHGNAWGLITGRDGYGFPTGIEWIPPDMVDVTDDPQQPWNPMRTRVYVYGRLIEDWRTELFHVKGYALPGRTEGISPLRAFALTVTSGIEAGKYGTDWFAAGGFPSGVFQHNELEVSREDAAEIRESLMEAIHGHKPLVIGRDWDYKPVSVPPSEAQFLEACVEASARFSKTDGTLCRADELVAGDKLVSWDDGELVPGVVAAVAPMPVRPTLRVRTQCGRALETSLNHPYWAWRDGGSARWTRADEIRCGDHVRVVPGWGDGSDLVGTRTAWSLVVAVEDAGKQVTYGVEIEGTHTHVTEGIVTHNTQMNATQLAAIFGLPPDRVGGARGDSLTYNCTSGDTEILTTRGWLTYDQVAAGDTCLTLNVGTGLAEWQPVTSVHVFDEGPYPVIKLENLAHSSVTTPDHRWPVMLSGRKAGYEGWTWKTTQTLPTDARICAAALVAAPAEPKWADSLVELVAWFWTEGWAGDSGAITLAQSDRVNPGNVARIRAALTELFGRSAAERGVSLLGSRGWQKRELIWAELARDPARGDREIARACDSDAHTVRNLRQGLIGEHDNGPGWQEDRDERGMVHFRLNAQAGALLTEHAPRKVVTTEFLSQLTRAQLELFVQVSLDADGSRHGESWTMGQKDKARLEAFQVACALTGRSGVIRGPNKHGMYIMPIQLSPWRKPKGHAEYVTQETTDLVWCVQTPNKSWFARRNGTCYFTGNTVEQSTLQVIEALRPWMVRLENAFFPLLPANRFLRFNADALLKTDLKTRTDIYTAQRSMGLRSIDELRDMEDLPPLPGAAGGENIPLDVMVAMSRSIRGIPDSMLKGITLELDLLIDRLVKLQDSGLVQPSVEPSIPGPAQIIGSSVSSARGASGSSTPAPVSDASAVLPFVQELLAEHLGREAAGRIFAQARSQAKREPEYVGPWIPSQADLARLIAANGNGNGHGGHS
jgi:phage portal protein BeeE